MNILSLVLSPAAIKDLQSIQKFSSKNWGKKRTFFYEESLKKSLWNLLEFPNIGIERNDLLINLRSICVEKHVVFYRLSKGNIEIIRVLHQRQDPQNIF